MTRKRPSVRCEFRAGGVWLNLRKNPTTGVDVGYKERHPYYSFVGERHPFWELLYIDKGLLRISVEETPFTLTQGEFLVIGLGKLHAVSPSTTVAPFYITVHFESNLEGLDDLAGKVMRIDEKGRELLAGLLKEKESAEFGAYQLMRCHLAEFLIGAVRLQKQHARAVRPARSFQANAQRQAVEKTMSYLQANLEGPLKLDAVCRAVGLSQSHLGHLFKRETGRPVIAYLEELRIREAKRLLLESALNVGEIAVQCGYSSIHLFSRRFKKVVSVCPSEFARMLRPAQAAQDRNDPIKSQNS